MKRLLCMFLCLLLLPVAVRVSTAEETETIVRVLLSGGGADSVSLKLSGRYAMGDKTVSGGTVTAKIEDGRITVSHSSQGTLGTTTSSLRLSRVGTDAATKVTYDNPKHGTRVYYGDFVFYNDGGTLRLLNYVDMKNYLYGVVSGEMSDSSKPDLLKTETICAKGFALAEIESRKTRYFDVYDTTTSQLYYGYVAEDKNTIAAVDAVWEQTLRYNGKIVKTYYSTANGGQAITPRIRWGGTANDGAYWFGYDPFDLLGSVKNVVLTVDGASPKNMDAALYAFLLEKSGAKEIVSVDLLVGVYDTDHPTGTSRYPSALAPQERYDWTLTVKDSAGKTGKVSFSCAPAEVKAAAASGASGAVCFAVHTAEKEWKLVWGVSSGHRTGLSHRGAGQMVKKGYSYVDVLKFYYRGATLYDKDGKAIESNATFDFTYEDGATPFTTAVPTSVPSATPSATAQPSATPTASTTPQPSATPTAAPSQTPSPDPGAFEFDVIVVSNTLQFREGPSTSYASIKTLTLGTVLRFIESDASGKWDKVYDEESGRTGWVHDDYVAYYEREPRPHREGVCNADNSNLRSGPSTNFEKFQPLNQGDKVYVYYETGNARFGYWYYVMDRARGQGGFIYKSYITPGADAPEVLRGDASGDGSISPADAALVLQYLVKRASLTDGRLLAADYTQNGTVDASDAAAILRHIIGLE